MRNLLIVLLGVGSSVLGWKYYESQQKQPDSRPPTYEERLNWASLSESITASELAVLCDENPRRAHEVLKHKTFAFKGTIKNFIVASLGNKVEIITEGLGDYRVNIVIDLNRNNTLATKDYHSSRFVIVGRELKIVAQDQRVHRTLWSIGQTWNGQCELSRVGPSVTTLLALNSPAAGSLRDH